MTFFTEQDTNRNESIPLSPECGAVKNDGCRRIHFPEIIRSHHMISAKPINDVYHMHDSYELLLFLGGCTDCYIEHHRYRLQRGDLLIINSQEIHRAVSYEGTPYERIATVTVQRI
ncbi:AraC family ligand binding domain-containing protein [Hungatella effluvii]|uniref:AraC family ligand binding domain-containing protein n=1 Tax=Hungatella effluvii TaxID=1096246 RepID=UPI002A81FE5F|nr:AraC family ligand binding domain-containing protein [Hungatella effluvii]